MNRATTDLDRRGTNGGIWEWTSTVFAGHDGLTPTSIFPGFVAFSEYSCCNLHFGHRYSSDFFDGKHQIVVRLR